MSNGQEWIGSILLTSEDVVYGSDGEQILNYNYCDGSELDAEKYPVLAGKIPPTVITGLTNSYNSSGASSTYSGQIHADTNNENGTYVVYYANGAIVEHPENSSATVNNISYAGAMFDVALSSNVLFVSTGSKIEKYIDWVYVGDVLTVTDAYITTAADELVVWSENSVSAYDFDGGLVRELGDLVSDMRGLTYHEGVLYNSFSAAGGYSHSAHLYPSLIDAGSSQLFSNARALYVLGYIYCLSFTDESSHKYNKTVVAGTYIPSMTVPTGSTNPYKIISDLYWYQIGDTIRTGSDKIRGQSGDYEFDALLNDGSAVDPLTHPQLYEQIVVEVIAGDSVSLVNSNVGSYPYTTACSADGAIVFVLDLGGLVLYRSEDYGVTFVNKGNVGSQPSGVACSSDGEVVYVVDYVTDSVKKSIDGGDNFTYTYYGVGANPQNVCCSSDGVVVYVTDVGSGNIYKSVEGGTNFTSMGSHFGGQPYQCACSSDGGVVYVSANLTQSLYKSVDGGVSFTTLTAPYNPRGVACTSDGEIVAYADISVSHLHISTDGGSTFTDKGALPSTANYGVACDSGMFNLYVLSNTSYALYKSTGDMVADLPNDTQPEPPNQPFKTVADLT